MSSSIFSLPLLSSYFAQPEVLCNLQRKANTRGVSILIRKHGRLEHLMSWAKCQAPGCCMRWVKMIRNGFHRKTPGLLLYHPYHNLGVSEQNSAFCKLLWGSLFIPPLPCLLVILLKFLSTKCLKDEVGFATHISFQSPFLEMVFIGLSSDLENEH